MENKTNRYNIQEILKDLNDFFYENKTDNIEFRIKQLKLLKKGINEYKDSIYKALYLDLGKSEFESYVTEVGFVLYSIDNAIKNLKYWIKKKKVSTPMFLLPSKSYIMHEPYGTVLIIGPYNYPFQLIFEPLIGAISAGNCVIIKPSELSPNISKVINKLICENFDKNYIVCIEGGIEINTLLINSNVDYIFFTGSTSIGKVIMKAAAENLTPITLELGGKSPVIVDKSANIKIAAKRIMWGKTLNAGQTCVAPDYVLVHESIKHKLIDEMIKYVQEFYGVSEEISPDFGRIINQRHFNRLKKIIDKDRKFIIYGGKYNKEIKYIQPTIICGESFELASMEEEIFGPILPVISYSQLSEIIKHLKRLPKSLSMYIFTENIKIENKLLREISSGGVCINDVITHLANPNLPFGGVGNSGIGSYHGYNSFLTFSHEKSILKKSTKLDIKLLFPPYNNGKLNLIKKFMK